MIKSKKNYLEACNNSWLKASNVSLKDDTSTFTYIYMFLERAIMGWAEF